MLLDRLRTIVGRVGSSECDEDEDDAGGAIKLGEGVPGVQKHLRADAKNGSQADGRSRKW